MITIEDVRRLIPIIGRGIRTVSPTTRADAVVMLSEYTEPHLHRLTADTPQASSDATQVSGAIDFLYDGANTIEAAEKRKYDAAVVRANLPPPVSGEVYLRGWRHIGEYDYRRGPIEAWLWGGFVPRVYQEEKHRPRGWVSYEAQVGALEIEDRSAPDPATELIRDEEFEALFQQIHSTYLVGHDWVEQAHNELVLIDIWRIAMLREWANQTNEQQAIIKEVLIDNIERKTVANKYRFKDRNGIDQVIRRYAEKTRNTATQLRHAAEGK